MYTIESGIKPKTQGERTFGGLKYPWDKLGVGDSFELQSRNTNSVMGAGRTWYRKNNIDAKIFAERQSKGVYRVFRIK